MGLDVLVVSAGEGARATMCRALRHGRLAVAGLLEAASGREALDTIEREEVDVVFVDMRMPLMDGIERVERRCADGTRRTVPVVGVALDGSVPRIERIMTRDVTVYIRKPWTPEMLRAVVEDVLGLGNSPPQGDARPA